MRLAVVACMDNWVNPLTMLSCCSLKEEEEEQRAAKGQLQDFLSGNAEVKEAKARVKAAQQAADLIQLAQTSPMEASQMAAKRQQLAKVRGGCVLPEPFLCQPLLESTWCTPGKLALNVVHLMLLLWLDKSAY